MNLTISGHHLDVTPAIREHVEGKFAPIERHGDHITHMPVRRRGGGSLPSRPQKRS